MLIPTAFLDLAGVVADFIGGVRKLYERGVFHPDNAVPPAWPEWTPGEYDVCKVIDVEPEVLWSNIQEDHCFWDNLEFYPWTTALVDSLGAFTSEVVVATSPCRDPDCTSAKVRWMRKLYGEDAMNYVLSPHKHFLAAPGRVLIDDNEDNCQRFEEHGGTAILFPQPWNSMRDLGGAPLHYVLRQLADICNKQEVAA